MQAAEMLRGIRPGYHLVFIICLSLDYVHTFPLQLLPSIPGYIPVYIRHGDQPLEDINPALAEAFHEGSSLSKNIHLDNIPGPADISLEEDEPSKNNIDLKRVRQTDESFSVKDDKSNEPLEEPIESKLVPDKSAEGSESSMGDIDSNPVVKINPLTAEEEKALEALQIETKKEADYSNNVYDTNSNLPEALDKLYHKKNEGTVSPVLKVDQIIVDESSRPDIPQLEDAPRRDMDENVNATSVTNEELPIKEQGHTNVLSNVEKLLLPEEVLLEQEKKQMENKSLEDKSK